VIGFFGNPDGLRALATALATAGTNVSTNASSVGGRVSALTGSRWTGGAATAFQGHWNGEYTDMVDLGLGASVIARVLNDLAASLDQANQVVLQAIGNSAVQSTVSMVTMNPAGVVTPAGATAAAVQQATQIAQRAWALATSQLAGVTVPEIGTLTSPQQALAWAQSTLAPSPTVTSLTFRAQDGGWQNDGKQPPHPPFLPPFDPALSSGGFVVEPGQPQLMPGPFPGSVITLQPTLSADDARSGSGGGTFGGLAADDWRVLAAAAAIMAIAALGGALYTRRLGIWQKILLGGAMIGRLLGGAHTGPMTPIEKWLDGVGSTGPPRVTRPANNKPGNNSQGSGDPPPDEFPPDDGEGHDDGNGGWVMRMPDGSVVRIGP
jgi:hypothetical protein